MMDPIDLLRHLLPIDGETPPMPYKLDIKKGWLIIAIKLPEEKKP